MEVIWKNLQLEIWSRLFKDLSFTTSQKCQKPQLGIEFLYGFIDFIDFIVAVLDPCLKRIPDNLTSPAVPIPMISQVQELLQMDIQGRDQWL